MWFVLLVEENVFSFYFFNSNRLASTNHPVSFSSIVLSGEFKIKDFIGFTPCAGAHLEIIFDHLYEIFWTKPCKLFRELTVRNFQHLFSLSPKFPVVAGVLLPTYPAITRVTKRMVGNGEGTLKQDAGCRGNHPSKTGSFLLTHSDFSPIHQPMIAGGP